MPALSNAQVRKLAQKHHLSDPFTYLPTGVQRKNNDAEIASQQPEKAKRLLDMISWVAHKIGRAHV